MKVSEISKMLEAIGDDIIQNGEAVLYLGSTGDDTSVGIVYGPTKRIIKMVVLAMMEHDTMRDIVLKAAELYEDYTLLGENEE